MSSTLAAPDPERITFAAPPTAWIPPPEAIVTCRLGPVVRRLLLPRTTPLPVTLIGDAASTTTSELGEIHVPGEPELIVPTSPRMSRDPGAKLMFAPASGVAVAEAT